MNKATPQEGNPDRCEHCGQHIYPTQGAGGTVLAHRDSKVIFCTSQGIKVWVVSRDTEDGDHLIEGVWTDQDMAEEVKRIVDHATGYTNDRDFACLVNGFEVDGFSLEDIKLTYPLE